MSEAVRRNVTIDWTVPQNARANFRVIVKRILRRYGYRNRAPKNAIAMGARAQAGRMDTG